LITYLLFHTAQITRWTNSHGTPVRWTVWWSCHWG